MRGHYGHYEQTKWAASNQLLGRALSFEYVLILNQIYLTTMCRSIKNTPIYLINLFWKLGLGLVLDLQLHYFRIFADNKEKYHLLFRVFYVR